MCRLQCILHFLLQDLLLLDSSLQMCMCMFHLLPWLVLLTDIPLSFHNCNLSFVQVLSFHLHRRMLLYTLCLPLCRLLYILHYLLQDLLLLDSSLQMCMCMFHLLPWLVLLTDIPLSFHNCNLSFVQVLSFHLHRRMLLCIYFDSTAHIQLGFLLALLLVLQVTIR